MLTIARWPSAVILIAVFALVGFGHPAKSDENGSNRFSQTAILTPVADLAVDTHASPPLAPYGPSIPIGAAGQFALMRFDTGYLPLGASVTSSALRLTFNQAAPARIVLVSAAHRWAEESINLGTVPQLASDSVTLTNSGISGASQGTYSGAGLTAWVNGLLKCERPNNGFAVMLPAGGDLPGLTVSSKEGVNPAECPALAISYDAHAAALSQVPTLGTGWPPAASERVVCTTNVADYGALPNTGTDQTAAFQKAITASYQAGGGIVYAPHGHYQFAGSLTIPPGVTLRGDWADPQRGGLGKGTVLQITGGRGDALGTPFVTLKPFAAVADVTFYYPDQSFDITPYPYTILSQFGAYIRCVTLVNSYDGIANGYGTGGGGDLVAEHIYGTPLHVGINLNYGSDYSTLSSIRFSPAYWIGYAAESGRQMPATAMAHLRTSVYHCATGILTGYNDTVMFSGVAVDGYRRGMDFSTRETGVRMNGVVDKQPSDRSDTYGQAYDVRLTNCAEALCIDDIQETGEVFCNCTFTGEDAAVSDSRAPVIFERCSFHGSNEGFRGLSPDGKVVINSSLFTGMRPINCGANTVDLCDNRFLQADGGSVVLDADVHGAVIAGDSFAMAHAVDDQSKHAVTSSRAPSPSTWASAPGGAALVRSPAGSAILYAANAPFNVSGDGVTDVSGALQKALDSLESTGGTVFLPTGQYVLKHAVNVPDGVELRGVGDVMAHPVGGWISRDIYSTAFLIEFGQGDEHGSPAISLGRRSGVRGVCIMYPARNTLGGLLPFPPAIVGEGEGCYVMMCDLVNPFVGVEMRHANNHLIKNIYCGTDNVGVRIVGGIGGEIEGFEDHAQFWVANLPPVWNMPKGDAPAALAKTCTSLELQGCSGELVQMCGQWSTHRGIVVSGLSKTEQADVTLRVDSLDSVYDDNLRIEGNTNRVVAIGLQSITQGEPACTVRTTPDFDGQVTLCAALLRDMLIDQEGPGAVNIESANIFFQQPSKVICNSGSVTIKASLSVANQFDIAPNGVLNALDNIDYSGALQTAPTDRCVFTDNAAVAK
jgi:hypothetical protein